MQWAQLLTFLLISAGLLALFGVRAEDFLQAAERGRAVTLRDELDVLTGTPRKGFYRRETELAQVLASTGREGKFQVVKRTSLILFAVGAVLALLMDNVYLVPVLGAGMALIPMWYIRSSAASYKKALNAELEVAISMVTTSYLRTNNLLQSVRENVSYMRAPVREHFQSFLTESELINANLISGINTLKLKIPNRIYHEWCDCIIQCQSDRAMIASLPIIVQKFSALRVVQADMETELAGPRREAFTMMLLVVANIPLLRVLNRDWFSTLLYSIPGKLAMAICAAIILFALSRVMVLSKPLEYGGDET